MSKLAQLKDVVLANFASLVYKNWDNVEPGSDVGDILFDVWMEDTTDMNTKSRHAFMTFSEDEDYETPIWDNLFRDWSFVYSSNDTLMARELFGIGLTTKTNGFYAAAWRKGSDVVIAFRGTNDIMDYVTDLKLAFFDEYHSQLTSVYWFIRHVRLLVGDECRFHFTGHSLGGALAQFAHILEGTDTRTVTWNTLGLGVYLKTHLDQDEELIKHIIGDIVFNFDFPFDKWTVDSLYKVWKEFKANPDMKKVYNEVLQLLLSKAFSVAKGYFTYKKSNTIIPLEFGFKHQREECTRSGINPENYNVLKRIAADVVGAFKTVHKYSLNINKHAEISEFNITNYVFEDDWTTMLQTIIGKVVDVTDLNKEREDDIDDSKKRVILTTLKHGGFHKHAINFFLLYMDDSGNITPGKMRPSFIHNVCREVVVKSAKYMLDVVETNPGTTWFKLKPKYEMNPERIQNDMASYLNKKSAGTYAQLNAYRRAVEKFKIKLIDNKLIIGRFNNIMLDRIDGRAGNVVIE